MRDCAKIRQRLEEVAKKKSVELVGEEVVRFNLGPFYAQNVRLSDGTLLSFDSALMASNAVPLTAKHSCDHLPLVDE